MFGFTIKSGLAVGRGLGGAPIGNKVGAQALSGRSGQGKRHWVCSSPASDPDTYGPRVSGPRPGQENRSWYFQGPVADTCSWKEAPPGLWGRRVGSTPGCPGLVPPTVLAKVFIAWGRGSGVCIRGKQEALSQTPVKKPGLGTIEAELLGCLLTWPQSVRVRSAPPTKRDWM